MSKIIKYKRYITISAIFCVLSVIIMIIAINTPKEPLKGDFIPPEFDSNAINGAPNVPEELGYIEPYADGMTFSAGFCGELLISNEKADIYFTNKAENNVWLMLRITDEKGSVLAKTGLVRPGEFVKTIYVDKIPEEGQRIIYKVMAYEKQTYYSMGYFNLATKAKIKDAVEE
jgi:hypothetical protein